MDKATYIGRLICTLIPEEVSDSVFNTLKTYKKQKIQTVMSGMDMTINTIGPEDTKLSAAIINSIMLGYMLSDIYDDEECRKIVFDKYFDFIKSQKGQNIIDFAQAKRERML